MMLGAASIDALQRIADRAADVLASNAPGSFPLHGDVRAATLPRHVDDPLSVSAPADAWFVTLDARGARTYTRAGSFHVDAAGELRGADGGAVLGFLDADASGVPAAVRLPEPDRTLGRCDDVRIEGDGTLAYTRSAIDPRTRERSVERVVVAQLALARFPAGTAPQRLDAAHVAVPDGVVPHLGRPGDGTFGPLATYARDGGALDLDAGLARLSEAYLSFRALTAAHRAELGGVKVALDLVK
jgi:hypothetical protein